MSLFQNHTLETAHKKRPHCCHFNSTILVHTFGDGTRNSKNTMKRLLYSRQLLLELQLEPWAIKYSDFGKLTWLTGTRKQFSREKSAMHLCKEPYLTKTCLAYMYSRLNPIQSQYKTFFWNYLLPQICFAGVINHYPTLYEYTYSYTVSLFTVQKGQPTMFIQFTRVVSASFWDKKLPQNDFVWWKGHDFMTWKWANHP